MTTSRQSAMPEKTIQDFVSRIYDAALDAAQWETVLHKLTVAVEAEQSILRLLDTKSKNIEQVYAYNKDPHWVQAYIDYYVNEDPWLDILASSEPMNLTCTHHVIADRTYKKMSFYNEFIAPQQVFYGLGGFINIKKDNTCYLSLHRNLKKGGFSEHNLTLLNSLAPHIQKSVLINERIQGAEFKENLFSDALSQLSGPLLLVNKYEKIVFINEAAEKVIKNTADLSIKNNRILMQNHGYNKYLQQLIVQATLKRTDGVLKQGGAMRYADSATTLSILVSPVNSARINPGVLSDEIALILLSVNNSPPALTEAMLKGLYHLTHREACLTLSLCQGLTLDEIAKKQCRSKNTLRAQLRSCFDKTGVSRQAELIRLVGESSGH